MPLTRHLYEIDEVVSALQIGLRKEEGLFWLWELVVSGETELAKQTLIDLWILNCGGYDSALLLDPPSVESYCRICTANPLQTVVDLLRLTAIMPSRRSSQDSFGRLCSIHHRRYRLDGFGACRFLD